MKLVATMINKDISGYTVYDITVRHKRYKFDNLGDYVEVEVSLTSPEEVREVIFNLSAENAVRLASKLLNCTCGGS